MTIQNDLTIGGGADLDRLLQTLPAKVERNIMRAALRAGAAVLRKEVLENVPVSNGDLRRSVRITARVKGGEVNVSVKAGNSIAYYAHMVEYGTRPHFVKVDDRDRGPGRGRGRKGTAGREETLASISTVNKRVLQIGANFIGPSVFHKGAKPHPFMRPAVDSALPRALEAATAKIRERLTKEGINSPPALPMDPAE